MGQYWVVVNVDARQRRRIPGELGESLWGSILPPTFFKLPKWTIDKFWRFSADLLKLRSEATCPRILRLPIELLYLIFEALDDITDIVFLCIAHRIFGVAGEVRLRRVHEKLAAAWAGDRVFSLGDYSDDYDFSEHIQTVIQKQTGVDLTPHEGHDWSDRFYQFVYEEYQECKDSQLHFMSYYPLEGLEDDHRLWALTRSVDYRRHRAVEDMLRNAYTYEDAVLCNLSKGKYVRADGLDKLNDVTQKRRIQVDLGHVVLANICWSSDPSCAMFDDISEKLTRGPWAGDRFEITSLDDLREGIEWKDVTKREVKWLADIFAADFGEEYDPDA